MPNRRLDALLDFVNAGDRICPMPRPWHEFWKLLDRRAEDGDRPPIPAILAGWWIVPELFKALRFRAQIEWAARHGALLAADRFLRRLSEREWHGGAEPLVGQAPGKPRRVPARTAKGSRQLSLRFRYARSRSTL